MLILEVFHLGPLDTNALLLGCSKTREAAVVDAPLGAVDLFLERERELALSIGMILLTHAHWDHIADLAKLKQKTQAKVYVHPGDRENVRFPGSDGLPLLFPIEGIEPDSTLADGQRLMLGELVIQVIHTPGHSPGSVCFYIEKEGVLLTGDTLFQGTIGNLSLPTAEPQMMWKSLAKIAKLPPNTHVYPGHGEETTLEQESWIKEAKEKFGFLD